MDCAPATGRDLSVIMQLRAPRTSADNGTGRRDAVEAKYETNR